MKTLRLIPVLVVLASQVQAQQAPKAKAHLNHVAIFVVDLAKTKAFYEGLFGLDSIPEPFHDGKHVWLRISEHGQLHIISGAKADVAHDINVHLSFSVPSLEAFTKHLDQYKVKYGNWAGSSKEPQLRPDKVKQVYLQDPDGYWIEINDDKF